MTILGHYQAANESEEEKKQGLEEHLINVAESARESANSITRTGSTGSI